MSETTEAASAIADTIDEQNAASHDTLLDGDVEETLKLTAPLTELVEVERLSGRRPRKPVTVVGRTVDPTLKTIEFGAVYRIRAPRTGEPWSLYKVSDDCGVSSIGPLDVPDGWDDSYECAVDDTRIWSRLARLAMDAYLAHAVLEVAFVPVVDEEVAADSYALLYRFVWPH